VPMCMFVCKRCVLCQSQQVCHVSYTSICVCYVSHSKVCAMSVAGLCVCVRVIRVLFQSQEPVCYVILVVVMCMLCQSQVYLCMCLRCCSKEYAI
jgi:hypothetical protein